MKGFVAVADVFLRNKQDTACSEHPDCFYRFSSDVRGHVRVGYLFLGASMDWERKQSS